MTEFEFWPNYCFKLSIQVFCTVNEENAPYDRQFEAKLMMPML